MLDPSRLFQRKLLLVTGKGGIGKTLVSAALGQEAARRGLRTLLVESAACDQIAPLFGSPDTDHVERQVSPNLDCINLHPPDNFRAYVTKYLGQKRLYDTVFSHRVVHSFISTIPGLAEVMLLGRLFYHAELDTGALYDLVIFDAYASGHFLSLMTTPQAVIDSAIGGPLVTETQRVKAFLSDPAKSAVVYTCVPEPLVISETLDFLPQLVAKSPARVEAVVVNRLAQQPAASSAWPRGSAFAERRWRQATEAQATLAAGLAPLQLTPWTLPELGLIEEPLPPDFSAAFFGL